MTRIVTIRLTPILIAYWVDFIVIPLLSFRRSSLWRRSCSSQSRFTPGVLDGVSTSFPRYRLPFDGGGNIVFEKKKKKKSSQLSDFDFFENKIKKEVNIAAFLLVSST